MTGVPRTVVVRDRRFLYGAAFVRALATGLVGVHLGIHLATIGIDPADIGVIVGAGLAGAAVAALVTTLFTERIGGRTSLLVVTALSVVGGVAVVLSTSPVALGLSAFIGMLNGMGRDRGAALIIEQAVLPSTTDDAGRTSVFARYNVFQDVGHAVGGLTAGLSWLLCSTTSLAAKNRE